MRLYSEAPRWYKAPELVFRTEETPMDALKEKEVETFGKVFNTKPICVAFAPGRVELLGNHTDYNGGFVLSVAIDLGIAVAAGRRPGFEAFVEVHSEEFQSTDRFPVDDVVPERKGSWVNYHRGVVRELLRAGVPVRGTRLAIVSNLPIGAGVSSSAALELATAEALYHLYGGRPQNRMEEAKLCQRAENTFVGVPCGILDQFSSLFGKKNHGLFLDCATLRYQVAPLGRDDVRVVLLDSGEKHELIDGKYAEARGSCERAVKRLAELLQEDLRFLRDVTVEEFERFADQLQPDDKRRAEHVIRENARVLRGLAALKSRHYEELKRLMLESHASSRDLFGNSTPALDFLVERASQAEGFLGGKLTGGGFGGSTVSLVEERHVGRFAEEVSADFERKFSRTPRRLIAGIGDGASVQDV